MQKRRLTSPPGGSLGDSDPAFSPDGRTLAFSRATAQLMSDLYLLSLSEEVTPLGPEERLTFENQWIISPVWGRDGREVIFSSGLLAGSGLWRMGTSVSGEPLLLSAMRTSGAGGCPGN